MKTEIIPEQLQNLQSRMDISSTQSREECPRDTWLNITEY